MNPVLGITGVLAALGVGFGVLRLLAQRGTTHPEVLRKLMHVWTGLVAAGFPWLFDSAWPVVSLAVVSFVVLLLIRSGVPGTTGLRRVLHGVDRASWGELLFPLAVAVVFLLADGDPLLYSVPILVLASADAVAALIGVHYGRVRFSTLEGDKSVEGSLAFFIVTFLCVHTAVLLFTDVGRAESLLIGALMGVVVMMFEAVAWRGLDNLFIPLAGFALLRIYLELDAASLLLRLLVLLVLGAFLLYWRRRSTLDDSALIGAGLVAYGAWALGGIPWLLIPVCAFVLATVATLWSGDDDARPVHTVHALLGIAAPGLMWLFLAGHSDSADLFFAYSVAFAAHLAMFAVSRLQLERGRLRLAHFLSPIIQGLSIVLLSYLLMHGPRQALSSTILIGVLAMLAAAAGFARLQPALHACPGTPARWLRQALIAGAVSVLAWLAILQTEGPLPA